MEFKFLLLNDCKELFFKVIKFIKDFPQYDYTLNNHIIKTVISIGSNIAEGNKRDSIKECLRFLNISLSSVEEFKFQLSLYNNDNKEILNLIEKIKATTIKIRNSLLLSHQEV